jgi:hypothetical protein
MKTITPAELETTPPALSMAKSTVPGLEVLLGEPHERLSAADARTQRGQPRRFD